MASLTVEHMRIALIERYPGDKWRHRVERMEDDQVLAVYHRVFVEDKKAGQKK